MGAVELSVEVKVELAQTGEDVMAAMHFMKLEEQQ